MNDVWLSHLLIDRDERGAIYVDSRAMHYLYQWLSHHEVFQLLESMSQKHLMAFESIIRRQLST